MKPTKHLKKEERGEQWKYNGGGELVQVYCMHVHNYHNEIPLYY
jgi:hypothetical protein